MPTLITKNSSTASSVPTAAQLVKGELAVNVTDKRLFTEDNSGNVVELGTNPSTLALPNGTANTVPYLNGSKVLTTGSSLVFDGSNLGLGTTSPNSRLVVQQANNTADGIRLFANGNDTQLLTRYLASIDAWQISASYASTGGYKPIAFFTSDTERARITSGGDLLINTSSTTLGTDTANVVIKGFGAGGYGLAVSKPQNGGISYIMKMVYDNTTGTGQITTTSTTVSYTTSSDYRLKENIQPMTGALAKVAALKPVTYKWKVNGSDGEGFIAHELAEVVPQCVVGEKDAVDAEGNPVYQAIDTSFLIATLTAAIQELKAELDSVKAELATLKAN